jgi:hypothetical protein
MSLRAEAYIARSPWLMDTPVSSDKGHLIDIGHTFIGLLGVAEVAVQLLDLPSGVVSGLDTARTRLTDALASSPILSGPLLLALDAADGAVARLLDSLYAQQSRAAGCLIDELTELRLEAEWTHANAD